MRIYPVWRTAHEGEYGSLLDVLLQSRGLTLAELDVGPEGLHAPELLTDLERGAERIERAVRRDETIVIYGDYDVDGVSSTALRPPVLELRWMSIASPAREKASRRMPAGPASLGNETYNLSGRSVLTSTSYRRRQNL